ncbi:MAG TPA: CHASE2 domain-containing protein, partial [Gammaproteobacteria bacterium]|nr:CHASE2 domain-containing protein [Gammaproteobacteria bacterium]
MLAYLKNKTLWGWALIIALALFALLQRGMGMESAGYRVGEALAPYRAADPQVAVVGIGAADLRKYGPWPWPRSYLAKLVDDLSNDKVEVAALALDFSAPQNSQALDYLTQIKALAADPDENLQSLNAKIDEAHGALDTDSMLAAAVLRSGHVLLAAPGDAASTEAAPVAGSPSFALQIDASAAPAVELKAPLPLFAHAARGVGYLSEGQGMRALPLLVRSDGHTIASLALLTAAAQEDVDTNTIGIRSLGGVTLGSGTIATDRHLQVLLRGGAEATSVPQYSFDDVISGAVQPERLAGKAVLVGRTDGPAPAVLREARLVSGLLASDLVSTPFWAWAVRALLTLLVGLYLMYLMPRLSTVIGIAVSAFLAVVLLNCEYVPLLSQSLWLPLILPVMVLVAGHALLWTLNYLRERSGVSRTAMSEVNREYGLALQALSRFDQALARFRQCRPSPQLAENLMSLGQEHERGRRYSQALEVYYFLQQVSPDHPGLAERLEHLRQLESTPTLTRGSTAGTLSRALASGGLQKPMLGRYELVQELGRGAMGVVYLGKDAKIGRQVAIKTMALADEFQGATLKDAHDRFFREAETAGRL